MIMFTRLNSKVALLGVMLFMLLGFCLRVNAQTATPWLTSGDGSSKLVQQAGQVFGANSGAATTITVNEGSTFQTMDGFGFALTQGSAEVINSLGATQQNDLLNEIFSSNGIGISMIRISIAASDLSSSNYSYKESSSVPFSLAGPDLTYVVPMIKRILAINPNIKILATPWSPPRWMKTNNAWVGGSLNTANYGDYATYFVDYLNAMKAQGINIWGITPQNEPENPFNNPSMLMTASEQLTFINNNLGPAVRNAGYASLKIIGFDHNCDNTSYPTTVAASSYVDGSAFHLYAGDISAMTTVRNNTGKNVYFTEQFTSSTGNFGGDLAWHNKNITMGSVNNWSKAVFEWNLANNTSIGPFTAGGCTTCMGAITINNSTSYTRNVAYYILAHMSKFVNVNATRIGSTSTDGNLTNTAFRNTDGSKVLVVLNGNAAPTTFRVVWNNQSFTYTLGQGNVVTFKWGNTTTAPATPTNLTASGGNAQISLSWSAASGAASYTVKRATTSGGPYADVATGVTSTSYTNTGLANGTTYYYVVSAVNAVGSSGNSNQASAAPVAPTIPAAPTGLNASAGNQQISLSWTGSAGASSYVVKRATVSGGPYTNVNTSVTATNFTDTGLTGGTTYYYVVAATNVAGTSGNSNQASAVPTIVIINAFVQIEAENFSSQSGTQNETCSEGGLDVGFTDPNDFIAFNNVDFGTGAANLDMRLASGATFTGTAELRLGSTTGALIGTVSFGSTGGWQNWVTKNVAISGATGVKNLYVVFQGGAGVGNVNWLKFNQTTTTNNINAFLQIEAESFTSQSGTQTEACSEGGSDVGYTDPNDFIAFNNVDFGSGAVSAEVRLASGASFTGTAEFRLGSTSGTVIGTVSFGNTGGWQNWVTKTITISGASGVKNLYMVFQGGAGVGNVNWLKFKANNNISAFSQIEAESFTSQSGTQNENCSEGGLDVGYTDPNDFIAFNGIDFGSGAASVDVRMASGATFTGTAQFRLGSTTGAVIGTISFGSTGGWQNWVTKNATISGATGVQNLYMVFQGGAGIGNINWIRFKTTVGLRTSTVQADAALNEPVSIFSADIYPTKSNGSNFSVALSETPKESVSVSVIGSVGNEIERKEFGEKEFIFQMQQVLSSGFYYVRIINGDKKIVKRLIVE
jgi:glucosylceramidase